MGNLIKIKKGLDIRLAGRAPETAVSVEEARTYGVVPDHYCGMTPRLAAREGDRVRVGDPVVYHKDDERIKLTAPVSGEITEVVRGAKRHILYISIRADEEQEYRQFEVDGLASKSRDEILEVLAESGLLVLLRKRPYDIIVDPTETPRDIYVTGHLTAPLTPEVEQLIDREDYGKLQAGIDLLNKLTDGDVYLGVRKGSPITLENCRRYEIEGPHPAANASVLINQTKPINAGEVVWTIGLTELLLIGRFLETGRVDFSKRVVLAGTRMKNAGFATVRAGANLTEVLRESVDHSDGTVRTIDGDVLTGAMVHDEYMHMSPFTNIIIAIPEGSDTHDLFGWALPGFNKYSVSRSFPTFLRPKKEYDIDARLQGGERAIIVSNEYDKVFPLDIFPEQLIKATIAFNIDKMEELGIYEVAPEDFALCEFVDTSKLELQYIIRKGLDELYKEMH